MTTSSDKSMTSQTASLRHFTDAAAGAVAREIATFRREAQRARELFDAECRARLAELDVLKVSVVELKRAVTDRLASLKDGQPGQSVTVADVEPFIRAEVQAAVSGLPPAEPGKNADPITGEQIAYAVAEYLRVNPPHRGEAGDPATDAQVSLAVGRYLEENPVQDGKDADPTVIARMVSEAVAALPPPRPGKDADPDQVAALVRSEVERVVAAIPKPKDGESVTIDDVRPVIASAVDDWLRANPPAAGAPGAPADPSLVAALVKQAVAALPKPENGKNLEPEDARPIVEQEVEKFLATNPPKQGAKGDEGPPGKLPLVRAWADQVHYEGDCVTHKGAVFQAARDTGREPPHADWACIVCAGVDGRSFNIRGTYSETEKYRALEVVALNGASFASRRDDPGPCPGEGWQLMASQGKQGKPGPQGNPGVGRQGVPGPPAIAMTVDEEGMLVLTNADGSSVRCDLYPVLAKLK